ncbi:MAG: DNA polymerase III subunit gamma/tau [Pyrinomonadaceae bacterium]
MAYQVIARKWRPQSFEDVIGQDSITKTLRNAIEFERLHHAYLFSGARGVGKTTTARLLSKALNCHKSNEPTVNFCDTTKPDACVSCLEISESRSIDVLEFDAASHTGVDEIRQIILESININPARDRYKVFIVDEVHMLSTSSFNALLKTLEEPPERVVFIMATTELHKIPDTIVSRCQQFTFRTIPLAKIQSRLEEIAKAEKIDISEEAIREVARSGDGSMRDAQSNFDQVISFSGERIETEDVVHALGIASAENLSNTVRAISLQNSAEILGVIEDLSNRGQDLRNFCRDLLGLIRDLTVMKLAPDSESLFDSSVVSREELAKLAEPFRENDLVRIFKSISETQIKLRETPEPRYLLEIGLIKLTEFQNLAKLEELAQRVAEISNNTNSIDVPESAPTQTSQEKKTLKSEIRPPQTAVAPTDTPFPVKRQTIERDYTLPEEPAFLGERFFSEPFQRFEDVEQHLENDEERDVAKFADGDFQAARKAHKSRKMPVRLEPIPAEDLKHIEDAKLDEDFETRLEKEGDNLRLLENASELVQQLFGVKIESPAAGSAIASAEFTNSRAAEIAKELSTYGDIPNVIPRLAENPTAENLREFAENHPRIIKLKRLFRAKIVDVKQKS